MTDTSSMQVILPSHAPARPASSRVCAREMHLMRLTTVRCGALRCAAVRLGTTSTASPVGARLQQRATAKPASCAGVAGGKPRLQLAAAKLARRCSLSLGPATRSNVRTPLPAAGWRAGAREVPLITAPPSAPMRAAASCTSHHWSTAHITSARPIRTLAMLGRKCHTRPVFSAPLGREWATISSWALGGLRVQTPRT